MLAKRRAIHVRGDQGIDIKRFLDWDTANERRDFARNLIEAPKHHVLARRLYPGTLQYVPQPGTGKARGADCALSPLNARNLRTVKTAAISGAFKRIHHRMDLQPR